MKCPNCQQTVTRKSKFCPNCGARIAPRPAPKNVKKKSSISAGYAIALIGLGIVLGYAVFKYTSKTSSTPASGRQSAAPIASVAVLDIAREFMCPCGSCNDSLDECTCDGPRGAVEVKGFIAQKIREGHKRFHIVEMVQEKYGHRKKP